MGGKRYIYWFATWGIRAARTYGFDGSTLPAGLNWIRGQRELGERGFEHYQLVFSVPSKLSQRAAQSLLPGANINPSKSKAADEYVWKEDTRIGERFEFGIKPMLVSSKEDWERIWDLATKGDLLAIPPRVRVVSYRTLRAIASDHSAPVAMLRTTKVFWGSTGTGKSRTAWEQAGMEAYCKDPRSKFWCGYKGQSNVIIDEFRGGIDIAHLLRWTDRYPVRLEIKGSSVPSMVENIWITSNLAPSYWYPDVDHMTMDALLRRLNITEFT